MALWPGPIHLLPFCATTSLPPVAEAFMETPSSSRKGPIGEVERPAKTAYPVAGPEQQFAEEAIR